MRDPDRELHQYLNRATRFVPRDRRADIREELHAHVEERTTRLQALGFSRHDAVRRALTELGTPTRLSWAFGQSHITRTVLAALLLAPLVATLGARDSALAPTVGVPPTKLYTLMQYCQSPHEAKMVDSIEQRNAASRTNITKLNTLKLDRATTAAQRNAKLAEERWRRESRRDCSNLP